MDILEHKSGVGISCKKKIYDISFLGEVKRNLEVWSCKTK